NDPKYKDLNLIWGLSELTNSQIDNALIAHLHERHNQLRTSHPKAVCIEGGGPNALFAALNLYTAGEQVRLADMRSELYSRTQIARLDPKWVADLNYYLGKELKNLIDSGWASIRPSGYVEIPINRLEDALKARLARLWAMEDSLKRKDLSLNYKLE